MPQAKRHTPHRRHAPARAEPKADAPAREPRAIWRGVLGFGLVEIPVRLLSIERADELHFRQLDKRDHAPVGNAHVNKKTGEHVEWSDVVKGYEISKGEFVIVSDEDFEKADVKATQSIDIEDFVPRADIPAEFFERPYLVVPDGTRGTRAYAILHDALEKKELVAVARVVIRTRQRLCAVMAHGPNLLLEILRFAHELKTPSQAGAPSGTAGHATAKEVALAEQLIEGMVAKWKPEKYRDTYRDTLLEAIKLKAKTGEVAAAPDAAAPRATAATDVSALLEQSLAKLRKHG